MTINRRKTEEIRTSTLADGTSIECVVWAIELDGEQVGEACATYKTKTQRTWDASMTVDGVSVSVEGIASISKAVTALNDQLVAATAADATPADGANIEIVEAEDATA